MRKMKDSGIEWIGEIPEEWEIVKTLYVLIMPITDGPHTTPELFDEGIPFVSAEAVSCGNGQIDFNHIRGYISKEFYDECCKKYIPKINDIYMIKSGATTGKVALVNTNRVFTIWSPLAVFRCDEQKMNYKYLYYTLQADYYLKQIETKWSFGTQQNIGMRVLEQLRICFPSMPEQQKISAFLDRKCSEIDSVTAKTKATIEEYKKLKQAIITQAVTKGIRKGRKMKDSGVEWIGEIPEEWIVSRVKYVSDFQPFCDTSHLSNDSIITYTPMENIKNGYYIDNKAPFGMVASSLTPYCEGDIVIAKVTPCFENGNISIMNNLSSGFGMGSSELFVVRPKIMLTKYLFYWLQNKQFISIACSTMTGTGGLKRVSPYFFKNSPICLPDNDEQKEISTYLDEKCTAIDTLIAQKEQLLTELESYKKSVIYEYVTGKKETI